MSKENKKFIFYIGLLILTSIISYKLPHDSFSISEYIVRPIRINGGIIYLSGLLPLGLIIGTIIGMSQLERFAKKSRLAMFFIIVIFILPFMKWSLDQVKEGYYWATKAKLAAIDMEDANITFGNTNNNTTIDISCTLISYNNSNQFKLRVYFPESISKYTGVEIYEPDTIYMTFGDNANLNMKESVEVTLKDEQTLLTLLHSEWYYDDVIYELYNDEETIRIIDRGL